jgi:2-hydroxychromene-2-carboxylate isomerase
VLGRERDLTDWEVLAGRRRARGSTPPTSRRASAPPVKAALRDRTTAAIGAGVFGVPTFALGGELFWGDRLEHLAARLGAGSRSPARGGTGSAGIRPADRPDPPEIGGG